MKNEVASAGERVLGLVARGAGQVAAPRQTMRGDAGAQVGKVAGDVRVVNVTHHHHGGPQRARNSAGHHAGTARSAGADADAARAPLGAEV